MAILPVYYLGQPILRETAAPIEAIDDELRTLVDDMFETMDAALGVGLAANQIGVARRVAVIDTEEHRFVMINPRVTASSGRLMRSPTRGTMTPRVIASLVRSASSP